MQAGEIIEKYISFFEKRGHKRIINAPLIPENDPTTLFTTAGMHPLVPYLLGEPHPLGKRLVGLQKCLRTDDIDEVGDNTHHTFFEMLGNWSLGGYWKKEAIEWSFEFLIKELKLNSKRLYISCFAGDKDAPKDSESSQIWESLGIPKDRIFFYGKKDNWWGPAGETGPCGPDTEMFYDLTQIPCSENCQPNDNCQRFSEIWNDVFMQYEKTKEGKFKELAQKNVDTGMGLERILAVVNGKDDNYQTDLFFPIIQKLSVVTQKNYEENKVGFRIIADHLKASVFLLSEEINPSNTGKGYVLRRLIRRAIRYGKRLGISQNFTASLSQIITDIYDKRYPYLLKKLNFIRESLDNEENKFNKTLEEGLKKTEKIFENKNPIEESKYAKLMQTKNKKEIFREIYKTQGVPILEVPLDFEDIKKATITGKEAFDLYQSSGFPIEMIIELVQEKNLLVDIKAYEAELKKHQELSRTSSGGMFKGGLADDSEIVTKYHTATHLLHAALRKILGEHVRQKGSNITAERLRFDFSNPQNLTDKELKDVEDLVNEKIKENLKVTFEVMNKEEALKKGALGFFVEKYEEKVKVYKIGPSTGSGRPFSVEICGGPHVDFTGRLKSFKIIKQENIGGGNRRIYAKIG